MGEISLLLETVLLFIGEFSLPLETVLLFIGEISLLLETVLLFIGEFSLPSETVLLLITVPEEDYFSRGSQLFPREPTFPEGIKFHETLKSR